MSDAIVGPLRASYADIAKQLDQPQAGDRRDQLKKDIIALFKTVDQAITDLSALKEEIRVLVDRYKQLAQSESGTQAPQFTGAVPVMADHIGASTFIQKGWSLISLGDYAGAVQALTKALGLSPGDTQAESLLGWAQMLNEDYDDALQTFQKVLNKEPANSPVKGFEALYGLEFHPRFAENRYCYVCYVVRGADGSQQIPDGTRVSRFRVTEENPPRAIPESEQVVIQWLQGGHNGGCLKFGPDGMLYISTGDGSSAFPPDELNAGQDVSNLLSSVLRIDVDHPAEGRHYSIPSDNPFVSLPGARGEIWCYGLRNPWKMSFDRATGDLWVGDVGWELWELVFHVERGGNYGWSVMEGPQSVHVDRRIGPTPILPPALSIPHTDGVSITVTPAASSAARFEA